jgi:hypothetical protein
MFSIGFVQDLTFLVMAICGLVGFLFSGEKVLSFLPFWGNTEDRNSTILKYLALIAGIISAVWLTLLIADEAAEFRWFTIAVFVAFIIVCFAHPVKDLEGWSIILLAIPFILIAIVAFWFKSDRQFNIAGTSIALWLILGIVALLMLILFLIIFFVEESFVDPVLFFLGWAPVVFIASLLMLVQGVLLLLYPINGLLNFI